MSETTTPKQITVYGAPWCPDCKRAKKFLTEQRVPFAWIDIEQHPEGQKIVQDHNDGKQIIPTILFPDGKVLVEPSNAQLAEALGLKSLARKQFYDLIVVGAGPAGLTAAIYAAREGIDTLVIEQSAVGGQAGITEILENYPGFSKGISGANFAEELGEQARRFGVEILAAQQVVEIGACDSMQSDGEGHAANPHRYIKTASGQTYEGTALLLATGSTYKRLEAEGEEDFIGAGVHFCATCDGPFYRDQPVFVVGGGNSAAEESLFLAKFASKVTLLVRGDRLKASKVIVDKVSNYPKLEIRYNTEVKAFKGQHRLQALTLLDTQSGQTSETPAAGVFVFIGLSPNTEFLRSNPEIKLDERGFILTNRTLETSLSGVFAAGDSRAGSTKQVAGATGEGATAALMIREYLKEQDELADRAAIIENDDSCLVTN